MKNKVLLFTENYLILLVCSLVFLVTVGLQMTSEFITISWFEKIGNIVAKAQIKNESTFLTISSIFVGIYFTIYTLLGSIKVESTFASIRKDNLIKFVKFIKYSFLGAFMFLFYSIFYTTVGMSFSKAVPYLLIISGTLLIYMLLCALRLGFVVYLIYENDLKNMHQLIEEEKNEKQKTQMILFRLEQFLKNYEEEESKKQAEYMKEQIMKKKSAQENNK